MKSIALPCLFFFLLLISCSDTTTIFENGDDDIQLETSISILDGSINYESSGVLDIYEDPNTTDKSSFSEEQAGDYPLTMVAQISPPSF